MSKAARGDKICDFIEKFCVIPEGKLVGEPMKLMPFQRKFIIDVFDNSNGTSRAYLSVGRKNGKSALIAAIVLAHLVGPEAKQNSQIISGARSREQAALVCSVSGIVERPLILSWLASALPRLIDQPRSQNFRM